MPLTVGGGLDNCQDIEAVLKKGADKVVLNTSALRNSRIIKESSASFGSQCIVISIDVKRQGKAYHIFSHSGLNFDIGLIEWCKTAESLGAGELLINSVDLDGKMTGYDYRLIRMVSEAVKIPVIICGGASKPADCAEAVKNGASAAAAASLFHFTDYTPDICKDAMAAAGIPVRLSVSKAIDSRLI
jgi:cyclase